MERALVRIAICEGVNPIFWSGNGKGGRMAISEGVQEGCG